MIENNAIRVRFAPSPTGALHLGGIRTALYNYLFAKKHGGTFLLRIEDTDQTRFVPAAEEYIKNALNWCGISPTESPWHGGQYAPYRQSERKEIYKQYAQRLLDEGKAYYAFDTAEELDNMRVQLESSGSSNRQYNGLTRGMMKNALSLSAEDVKQRLDSGEHYVIRLKVPLKEEIRFHDLIRGWITVNSATLDDKVLMKSDGMPTYHLANIVDDYLMKISHVIRGEEWLPSAPLHVLLYRFLGWEEVMPQFAHLPLLLKPDGEGKLSKRDGDRLGFSVFPLEWRGENAENSSSGFREDGYLPDAFINFIALLGWNSGTEQEIFTIDELANLFSLEKVHKAGAKFDINKAKWFNQQYLKEKTNEELGKLLLEDLAKRQIACTPEKAAQICGLMKERITFIKDIATDAPYWFESPRAYDQAVVAKRWTADAVKIINAFAETLKNHTGNIDAETAKHILHDLIADAGLKMGAVMPAVRLAITGLGGGAELMDIVQLIGKEETISRLEKAIQELKTI